MRFWIVVPLFIAALSCDRSAPSRTSLSHPPPTMSSKEPQWIASFDRGAAFLLSKQSDDGAWRSEVYGHFKHGDALTPLAVVALQRSPEKTEIAKAVERGIAWMRRFVIEMPDPETQGTRFVVDPKVELQYPVYTAALTIIALSDDRQKQHARIRDAWVTFLISHQFRAENGWTAGDWQTGGWGYSGIVPVKPTERPIPPALEANLSATAYALTALRKAGQHHRDPVFGNAVAFVHRCRNPDGGFFFTPGDPFRNKAGMTEVSGKKPSYRSYGSATADGIRCLRALAGWIGAEIEQSQKWVFEKNPPEASFIQHGEFAPEREKDRDAAFFYYAAALSEEIGGGAHRESLVNAVVARQRADGTWQNELNTVREDDPVVATALAMMALRWTPGME